MPAKIRSNYRRRLLTHLSIGASRVSDAASVTGLRLPHASAELKKLRNEGHVSADRDDASRGAMQRLTASGYSLLESDELARLRVILRREIPLEAEGCIVARDGDSLLLAYAKKPQKGLFLIPVRSFDSDGLSSGNKGGGIYPFWAWPQERAIRWYDAKTLDRIEEPEDRVSMDTLEGWSEQVSAVGLVRARALSGSAKETIAVGSWFCDGLDEPPPELPHSIRGGEWTLGEVHDRAPLARPDVPVVAVVKERYIASMLADTAREGACLLSDKVSNIPLPVAVLERWIHEAHPRLPPAELRDRLSQVQKAALTGWRARRRRSRVSTTWQRFRDSWADVEWQEEIPQDKTLEWNISKLDDNAVKALMHWVVMDRGQQLVVNWPTHRPFERQMFDSLLNNHNVRLVILPEEADVPSLLVKEDFSGWPAARLVMLDGSQIPFILTQQVEETTSPPDNWNPPSSPSELRSLPVIQFSNRDPEDEEEALLIATSSYPQGDEEWANRNEGLFPLAAWIATPEGNRWSRWQRIGDILEPIWFEMLQPEQVPLVHLLEISEASPVEWRQSASNVIRAAMIEHPDVVMEMRRKSKNAEVSAICSEHILATAPWTIPYLGKGMAGWAWKSWSSSPSEDIETVLPGITWCSRMGYLKKSWADDLVAQIPNLAAEHPLHSWKMLMDWSIEAKEPSLENMRILTEALHIEWWAHLAPEILFRQLENEQGREWLVATAIPWAAVCLRPIGETVDTPGIEIEHPGMTPGLQILMRHHLDNLEADDGDGASQLLDLMECLEDLVSGGVVRSGRIHPCVGWLARPVDEWGSMSMSPREMYKDENVEKRISQRLSGFHRDLLNPGQIRLP